MNCMQICDAGSVQTEPLVGVVAPNDERHQRVVDALEAAHMSCYACVRAPEDLAGVEPEPEVVVLYAGAEGADPIQAVRIAREVLPDAALVAVWPENSAADARRALRAGADGLARADGLAESLGLTIRTVRNGLSCVPASMRDSLESESLSMREKQVLAMLVTGLTNAEIATKLFVAESTVKSHLSSAYNKLGVRSRKDAASRILDPEEGLGPGILAISAA